TPLASSTVAPIRPLSIPACADATPLSLHDALPISGQVDSSGEGVGYGEPLVSPDGRKVMLPRHGIAVVSLATGKQVWHGAGEEADAAWSPDARRIVFGGAGFAGGMFVVDLRSGRRRTLIPSADDTASDHTQILTPAWSP